MRFLSKKRDIVIIVDDDAMNLAIGRAALYDGYDVFTALSGEKLFALLSKIQPDLILLDIEMPVMNGYEVIIRLKSSVYKEIPVIFLTGKIEPENEIMGLNMGAVDYVTKPFTRELLIKRVDLHIAFGKQKKELKNYNLRLESEVDKKTRTVLELQNVILKTVAELVECRDNVTGGHIERTQHCLRLLIEFLLQNDVYTEEISTWDVDLFIMSSQLHDVGKISIKDSILMKPGKLSKEECEEMKKHTLYGVEIIKRIEENTTENAFLEYAEILAGSHHEKWNGKGYPFELSGSEIPLHGRLMALVDVYDALTNERPYKKAFSHEKSVGIIREERGEHFDPNIVDVFLRYESRFAVGEIDSMHYSDDKDKLQPAMMLITNAIGARGGKEYGYTERMKSYLEILLKAMLESEIFGPEVSAWDKSLFLMSAQMHDLGKIAVSDHVLNKAVGLSEEEYEDVKTHVDFGVRIIKQVKGIVQSEGLLHHAEMITGSHHEKWDGTGYPLGLKGRGIPLQGRVMSIVDVYDALTSDRPHRKRLTHGEAAKAIVEGSGTHFDPDLVELFKKCVKEFEKVNAAWE